MEEQINTEPSTAETIDVDRGSQVVEIGDQEAGEGEQVVAPAPGERMNLDQTQMLDGGMMDFKIKIVDGMDVYECSICSKTYKAKQTMKSHLTKVHKKPKEKETEKVAETEKDDADVTFDMNRLNRWQKASTQKSGGIGDKTLDNLFLSQGDMNHDETDVENEHEKMEDTESLIQKLEDSKTKLKSMEEEFAVMTANAKEDDAKIESLEDALKSNKELLDISQATANSLEIKLNLEKDKTKQFEGVFKTMEQNILTLENAAQENVDPVSERQIKSLKDELKTKKKEIDDANKRANDAIKKLKDETNARSKAEAENIKLSKMITCQSQIIDKMEDKTGEKRRRSKSEDRRDVRRRRSRSPEKKQQESPVRRGRNGERRGMRSTSKERRRSKEKCWDFEKPEGCKYGPRCKYFHPEEGVRSKSKQGGGRRSPVQGGRKRSASRGKGRRSPSQEKGKRSSVQDRRKRSASRGKGRRSQSQEKGRRSRSKELCWDVSKPGGCARGPRKCKYSHPEEEVREECAYWLHDTCTFGGKCRGLHDPTRRGVKNISIRQEPRQDLRQESRKGTRQEQSQEQRRSSTDGQDFVKSLVSLVSQGIAKGSTAPTPQPLPALPALPMPFTRRVASPGRGAWRTIQVWEDGSGAQAEAGLERSSFWRQ